MIKLFGKQRKMDVSEIKRDLLANVNESEKQMVDSMVGVILHGVFANNAKRFNGIEKDMLVKMFNMINYPPEEIENYLRKKIRNYDKEAIKALNGYYHHLEMSREILGNIIDRK